MYSNGTLKVQNYINRMKNDGDLIDIYSHEWLNEKYKDDEYVLERIKELEIKNKSDFIGHMLIVHLADETNESLNELLSLYKPLKNVINAQGEFGYTKHNPDFLFINLYTKQILATGLGRKNRLFLIDVESNANIELRRPSLRTSASQIFHNNENYYENFTSLDALDIVSEIIVSLEKLGIALFEYAHCRNRNEIEDILQTKPNKDGYYFIDDLELTKEELENELDEIDSALNSMDEAIEVIQDYFQHAEIGELNTGDY
jgi:hypothetical protein